MRTAVFAGTFSPFTVGHQDIVERGLQVFDRVIIAVGKNRDKSEADRRQIADAIASLYTSTPRVSVEVFDGLVVDFARQQGAQFLLRGVRSMKDYDYEREMADANRRLSGIETVLLVARPELAYVSSSLIRELQSYGKDCSSLLAH